MLGLNQWALVILGAALVASGCYVKGRLDGKASATHAMQIQVAQANARAEKLEKAQRQAVTGVDHDLATKQSSIADSYAVPLPTVRLCSNTYHIEVSRDPGAARGHDAAAEGNGLSRDVSTDLARLLRVADTQTAQLIACQAYVRELVPALK